jgi:hypothetical protein
MGQLNGPEKSSFTLSAWQFDSPNNVILSGAKDLSQAEGALFFELSDQSFDCEVFPFGRG